MMTDIVPPPPTRRRVRKTKRRTTKRGGYDYLRALSAGHETYYERLAFAVVAFALIEARGYGNGSHKKRARDWLQTERGRAMLLVFDLDADWILAKIRAL